MSTSDDLPDAIKALLNGQPPIGTRRANSLKSHLAEVHRVQALEMTHAVLRFADGIVAVGRYLKEGCIDLAEIELEIMARDIADFLGSDPLNSKGKA